MMNGDLTQSLIPPNNSNKSSKWFNFKPPCNFIPKLQKYLLPKGTRLKVLVFVLLLCLTVFLLIYLSCFSSSSESSMCSSSNLIPNLNYFSSNKTFQHFSHQSRHLPQCIIIGIRKAGTRALLSYLSKHSGVVTGVKEMHFFNVDETYHQGLEYYRKLMPYSSEGQLTMEKTPAYFTEPLVPERIHRMNKTIQLLLIVREPVTRLISDYTQLREQRIKRNKTPIPFELEVLDHEGDVDLSYKPVQTSLYYKHIVRWMEIFSWEQIHIVDGDRLISDPYSEMYKVETFLGLSHEIRKEDFFFNETKGFFCVKNTDGSRPCLQASKGRKHPEIDPPLLKKLHKFYAPRNKLFFQFINRTFDWN